MVELEKRLHTLEMWQESVAPMLRQLSEDQAYRARWREERAKRWSRWQRSAAFTFAATGAVAVVVAAVIQLAHLL